MPREFRVRRSVPPAVMGWLSRWCAHRFVTPTPSGVEGSIPSHPTNEWPFSGETSRQLATAPVSKTGERKPCGFDPHSLRSGRRDDSWNWIARDQGVADRPVVKNGIASSSTPNFVFGRDPAVWSAPLGARWGSIDLASRGAIFGWRRELRAPLGRFSGRTPAAPGGCTPQICSRCEGREFFRTADSCVAARGQSPAGSVLEGSDQASARCVGRDFFTFNVCGRGFESRQPR